MAANQFLSLPATQAGKTPASLSSAWDFGSWIEIANNIPIGIKVLGFQFQVTFPSGTVDTTFQILFEIGKGVAGEEQTQAQIPFSHRLDTAVGYYLKGTVSFPEPLLIIGGTRLTVRVTDSITSIVTYQGVKLIYEELISPTVTLQTPSDAATNQALLPVLSFTGTDVDNDTIEYNVQIDTANTFNSGTAEFYTLSPGVAGYTLFAGASTAWGQSFNITSNTTLKSVSFLLASVGVPTGNAVAKLYAHSGTYGTTSIPTGAALATSDALDSSLFSSSYTWQNFVFSSPYTLIAGTDYVIAFEFAGGDASNNLVIKTGSASLGTGNASFFSGSWAEFNTEDLCIILYNEGALYSFFSAIPDTGFTAGHPFTSGVQKSYTVQSSLVSGTLYYWRVRAIDPLSSNAYGEYSSTFSFTTLAGSVYNEGVTLTTNNSFSTILDLILTTTVTLSFDSTIVSTTIADLIAVASINSVHQTNAINEVIMEVSANMAIDATITEIGGLDFNNTITLDSDSALIPLLELIIESSTSLSSDSQLLTTTTMDAIGNTNLTSEQTLSIQTTLDMGAVILLSLDQTITPSSIVDFIAEVALTTNHQVSIGIAIIFESSVNLETIQQFSAALDMILDASVSVVSDHTVVVNNIITMEEGIELFTEQTISETVEVILETVVFLDLAGSLVSIGGLSFDASVFLTSDNVLIGAASLDIASDINLTIENQLAGIANLDVVDAIVLSSNSDITLDATLEMLTSMSLITDSSLNEENIAALSAESIYLSEHNISISGDTLAEVSVALTVVTQMSTEEAIEYLGTIEQLTENQVLFDLVLNMYEQLALNSETITTFDVVNTINEVLGLYLQAQTIVEINQDIEALLIFGIGSNIEMIDDLIPGGVPGNLYEASISLIAHIMLDADSPLEIFMKIIGVAFIKNINTIRG